MTGEAALEVSRMTGRDVVMVAQVGQPVQNTVKGWAGHARPWLAASARLQGGGSKGSDPCCSFLGEPRFQVSTCFSSLGKLPPAFAENLTVPTPTLDKIRTTQCYPQAPEDLAPAWVSGSIHCQPIPSPSAVPRPPSAFVL